MSVNLNLREKVKTVFSDISDTMHNLSMRWDDEKEYEDIEDYRKVLQEKVSTPITMTKKPFGFKTNINDKTIHFYIKKYSASQELCAKVVK